MNSLDALAGLNPQGQPMGFPMPNDPMLQAAYQGDEAMMGEMMGVPPMDDPYGLVGMEQPEGMDMGQELAYDMLGGPAPQLSQADLNSIAQRLGLTNYQPGVEMTDPMYAPHFNVMNKLGGM